MTYAFTLACSLRDNKLGTEGWCAIFAALRDNKEDKIESWDLSGQGINPEIAKVLAEYVSVSAVLKTLYLGRSEIGDAGAAALGEALKVNAVLNTIGLGYNRIGDQGAAAIAGALEVNAVLNTLNLKENNIGPDGAKAIAKAVAAQPAADGGAEPAEDDGAEPAPAPPQRLGPPRTVAPSQRLGPPRTGTRSQQHGQHQPTQAPLFNMYEFEMVEESRNSYTKIVA